jgi:hypothetical protein
MFQMAATVGLLAIDGPTHVRQNVGGRSIYSVDLSGRTTDAVRRSGSLDRRAEARRRNRQDRKERRDEYFWAGSAVSAVPSVGAAPDPNTSGISDGVRSVVYSPPCARGIVGREFACALTWSR